MRTRYLFLLQIGLVLTDLAFINGAYLLSLQVVDLLNAGMRQDLYLHRLLVYNLMWLAAAGIFGMYSANTLRLLEHLYRSTWRTVALQMAGLVLYFLLTEDADYTRQFLVTLLSALAFGFLISRFVITIIDLWYRRRFRRRITVGVVGFNATGIRLGAFFARHPLDYSFAGILDEGKGSWVDHNGRLREEVLEYIRQAARRSLHELYVSLPPESLQFARPLLAEAEACCIRLKIVPDLSGAMASSFRVRYMDDFPVFSLREEPLEDIGARFKKRTFDIVFSLLVIVLVLSWLYPILALLIKWQSPGPVLFKQQRSGRDNQPFWCYKFRSMRVNKESDKRQASRNDDRITPIGRFLRKTSLDELPQFFNVLKGEMSVVGPRPHMLAHTEQYRAIINTFMVRHFLKPGITGWAQVQGLRGETRDPAEMAARVEKDIWYLEHWTLMLDIRIIFLTAYLLLRGDDKAF